MKPKKKKGETPTRTLRLGTNSTCPSPPATCGQVTAYNSNVLTIQAKAEEDHGGNLS